LLLLMSQLTGPQHQVHIAIVFFFVVVCVSTQDISVAVLALKQLNSPGKVSLLETVMRSIGRITGSLLFLNLSSK
jgi:hypothetical protein